MSNLSKCENIYRLKNVPYNIYKPKEKTFKVTICATKSRFSINCVSKFTLFLLNFNVERE